MKIATWNINSIRARIDRLQDFLINEQIDICCLQETKMKGFPDDFSSIGYDVIYLGSNQYNGVAVLFKSRILVNEPIFWESQVLYNGEKEPRVIGVDCNLFEVFSVYIPNGRQVESDHYNYKLDFIKGLAEFAKDRKKPCIFLGDFNIIPQNEDVYDGFEISDNKLYVSKKERSVLKEFEKTSNLTEVSRLFIPQAWTYYDYRANAFARNMGMRIDFVYAHKQLIEKINKITIDKQYRQQTVKYDSKPSDHVPIIIELSV